MTAMRCAAVDLGAASGRVVLAECDGERLALREALRFETPVGRDRESGYQCWDLDAIEARVLEGLRAATAISPLQSLGVDTWGVDYVLLDAERRRVGPAVSYRDGRTRGIMEEVFARIPAEEIYRRTGIQFMIINTLYQLAATARRLNFSNEGGLERRYRVLKNIMGLWLVQRIRQESGCPDHATLVEAARAAEPWRSLVNPDDSRFLNPPSMTATIRDFCAKTGQPVPEGLGGLARCAIDSLALSYRRVKDEVETLRGASLSRIHIVGGGCQNRLLDQLCADACRLPVSAGPVETTALGNACSQLMALGVLHSLADARALVRQSYAVEEFLPREAVPEAVWERFQSFAKERTRS